MSGPIIKLAPGRVRFKVDNPKGWKWTVVIWMAISAIVDDLRRRRKVLSAKVDDHSIESWTTLWRIHCLLFGPSIFVSNDRPVWAFCQIYIWNTVLFSPLRAFTFAENFWPPIFTDMDIGFLNRLGYHPDSTSIDQYYEPVNLRPVADPLR